MNAPSILLRIPRQSGWRAFSDPIEVFSAGTAHDVIPCLERVERAVQAGRWAAGFVCYEAAAAFGLPVHAAPATLPLVWFGVFPDSGVSIIERLASTSPYRTGPWTSSVTDDEYLAAIRAIKDHIAAGDTYQINYTFRLVAEFAGNPLALLIDLDAAQRGPWGAYVDIGSHAVCSASPELFVLRDGARLECRPMKGTSPRGLWSDDDLGRARELQRSEKNRAENVMVVDMTRNDLGRIAASGTVHVPALFEVERYPGQWQMTSTVVADAPGAALPELFAALFPSGSVTGAPKHSSMGIIQRLESGPRGVYTGAIGCVGPDGKAHFNVGIRTVTVDRARGQAEFGVGSGIVWDSVAEDEFAECLNKAAMLARRPLSFQLIETMGWDGKGGIARLPLHLARMRASAQYFGFDVPSEDDLAALLIAAADNRQVAATVRLLLARDGTTVCEFKPISELPGVLRVATAADPVSSGDVFLFHKTTRREVYERARAARPDVDSVLLWNERREATEATEANVVVEIGGKRLTPQLSCGLLPGVFRAELLARGEIQEGIVRVDDLSRATGIWLINSLRGWMPARLVKA